MGVTETDDAAVQKISVGSSDANGINTIVSSLPVSFCVALVPTLPCFKVLHFNNFLSKN